MINTNSISIGLSSVGKPTHSVKAFFKNNQFQLGKKEILIFFRSLVFTVIFVLLFFNEKNNQAIFDTRVIVFFSLFFISIVAMSFVKKQWFDKGGVLSIVFVIDILFIAAGIYLAGIAETDLFLIFFTTVFISALSQDVKSVFLVAVVACALYGFLQYKTTGYFFSTDTVSMVRFPFLFVAAAMSGYMATETKKNQEERNRLLNMNQFLAEQADHSAQKLMDTNHKLKSLLEYHHCVLSSLKTGVIVVRKDGKIRTFNSGARQITGYVESDMADRALCELPENLKPVSNALTRTLEEEKSFVHDHLELKSARSENVPITMETSLLRGGNGEIIGAIATLRDVSLLRQMETQLVRSERLSALGEMAAGVAHEIKNPLNAIMGFSKRLSNKLTEPSLKKYADIIAEEVVRMDGIVNDVLEYSRPDKVQKSEANINQILDESVVFLDEKLGKANIEVEKVYDELPLADVDIPKMRQVILNLMLNAVQAMCNGGKIILKTRLIEGLVQAGTREKTEAQLFQQLFLQQKMISVSIQDTGCGIPKENISKLFHPFFTTKITGTGLGLSIIHKIIASHGGTLDVESEVGKGSVFTFYLPLEEE